MTATTTDRLDGLASSTAVKGPCKAASTTNLTLSGAQTVNGVSIVADDRVLVTGQTDGRENGVYVAATSVWRRAKDFSSNNDVREGTQVRVNDGTNAGIYVVSTADPIVFDTSTITLTRDTALTSGALMAANNLSDVASAVAALWNLRNNGADIASASTLVLNNATGDQVDVTGAVTITAVTLAEDREVWCRFTGTPQITVGASLIGNAGGSNITMAAGDIVRFRGYAAGVVRFTVFRVSGQALANPTASPTEVLTGTDTSKLVTPDALAALWEKGADIASATTITIAEGGYFHITGTTTIADIDWATPKNGRGAWLIFDGALTLTYNATTLTMPGAASITTAAGDVAYVVQDASDNAKILFYQRASGSSVVAPATPGWALLETLATTSGTSVTSSDVSSYSAVMIVMKGVSHSTTTKDFTLEFSTDGASYGAAINWIIGASNGSNYYACAYLPFNRSLGVAVASLIYSAPSASGAGIGTMATAALNAAGAVRNVRFAVSGGAFDAGSVEIWVM